MRSAPRALLCAAALLAAACSSASAATTAPSPDRIPAAHPTATGSGGSVASMDIDASRAGIAALRAGGNAVDAAVATASALGVTNPFVAGPGGGGYMVIYDARHHDVTTIDGRETCPASCTRGMFLDHRTHKPLDYESASFQPLSTGVPGMVAAWQTAVRAYGARSLRADLQPAIGLARRGFRVNRDFRRLTRFELGTLRAYPATRALLLTRAGNPLPLGTLKRDPDLARTYELIARRGTSAVYDGPIGDAIVNAVRAPQLTPGQKVVTMPGRMTAADLRAYRVRRLAPTRVSYRGLDVFGMAPPSSGGTTISEALNILSRFPLRSESRVAAMYHFIEASRIAYADRDRWVGDPLAVTVPLRQLVSPRFGRARACLIRGRALRSPLAPGDPYHPGRGCATSSASASASTSTSASPEAHHTNNIVATDRAGDIVAFTNTINFFGGSGQTVPGYGFLLNDELTDFDFAPPKPGTPDPNLPGPRIEPRSSMGPVIAFRDGRPRFAIGAAGGSTIPTTILQTLIGHVDLGMSLRDALAAPRVSQTDEPASETEPAFYHSALRRELQRRYGEKFELSSMLAAYPGDATAVQVLGGGRVQSIAEPKRLFGGSALVVHPDR